MTAVKETNKNTSETKEIRMSAINAKLQSGSSAQNNTTPGTKTFVSKMKKPTSPISKEKLALLMTPSVDKE